MKQQFTIQAVTDCTIEYEGTIEYSTDYGHTWNTLSNLFLSAGHEAQFRNAQSKGNDSFIIEGYFNVYGHISTLAPNGTTAFMWMFLKTNVIDASKLILDYDELWPNAYYSMFYGCTSLATAPELPAMTLDFACYSCMFNGCTSLRKSPELPAMTIVSSCYSGMFYNCTSLTSAPELPAMTLADYCYAYMFQGCTSLETAPILPATEMDDYCYAGMFQGCTSMATAPELHATKLEKGCYEHMLQNCENIEELPLIPKQVLISALQMGLFS